jgi:hypothetical protein
MTSPRFTTCAALAVVVFAGCSSNNQRGRTFTLPSGKVIRVLGMGRMNYMSGAPPSLMFQYQTDLKISDKAELRKETSEIWRMLQVDADRGSFTGAIISAQEVPQGFVFKHSSGYNFVYEKRADGTWHCLDDDREVPK